MFGRNNRLNVIILMPKNEGVMTMGLNRKWSNPSPTLNINFASFSSNWPITLNMLIPILLELLYNSLSPVELEKSKIKGQS